MRWLLLVILLRLGCRSIHLLRESGIGKHNLLSSSEKHSEKRPENTRLELYLAYYRVFTNVQDLWLFAHVSF